ncbi:MAG: group 1 truncated hemoglobin [Pseudomonadota bacterium]|nr:group 1 truncated hemoglobin [Pseudomonadota bacterium]MDO7710476.1 group 1 truncated hemoglobin [Pseudomonadota bacterium]
MQRLVTTICLLFLLVGCAMQAPQNTLYDKLGGEAGVDGIVSGLIKQIGQDKQIFHYFADANISRFRTHLTTHLCAITDGPCQYTGDSMTDIHTGMKITEKDFNHLVDLLINAMNLEGIPHRILNQLIAKLVPLRVSIIYI